MATRTVSTVTSTGWHRHRQGQGGVESRGRKEAETPTMVEGERESVDYTNYTNYANYASWFRNVLGRRYRCCRRRVSYAARQFSRRSGPNSGVVAGIIVPCPICYCSPLRPLLPRGGACVA